MHSFFGLTFFNTLFKVKKKKKYIDLHTKNEKRKKVKEKE